MQQTQAATNNTGAKGVGNVKGREKPSQALAGFCHSLAPSRLPNNVNKSLRPTLPTSRGFKQRQQDVGRMGDSDPGRRKHPRYPKVIQLLVIAQTRGEAQRSTGIAVLRVFRAAQKVCQEGSDAARHNNVAVPGLDV
ncbi:uncharacterized protein CIMG_12775 [Coccidioides immitis RS]|uniref:Uncharacterized protein n=1 Tax=Coccidioides immitis (strain RS) TaxID=246410 RepID=A0A0E1RZV7_COCIM|nr:uncharacterized protein CIMG_12775 [Coccidioides immitis RS]EAS36212.2 hypothetical protein CIMG_12775 [Coccidioides immitis RS]